MLRIRVTDARMMALQRQGRIGFYGEAVGQEAAIVGSAAVTHPDDWIVPALREAGVGLFRGMTLDSYIAQIFGNAGDVSKGRQMPSHPCDRDHHYVVMSSCVSTQIPHAVGIAMAMKLSGHSGRACFGYMGDGGTSEGDFHVALNFAGVTKAPCVLICQNNQWAISTPGSVQTASQTIALKALGYGIEPIRADGNDVFAVYSAVGRAADKARRGGGPTFIELLTYRVSAHSSSDDPSRYRDESVTEVWRGQRDPIRRMELWMRARGWLADGEREALADPARAGRARRDRAPGADLPTSEDIAGRGRVRAADVAAARAARHAILDTWQSRRWGGVALAIALWARDPAAPVPSAPALPLSCGATARVLAYELPDLERRTWLADALHGACTRDSWPDTCHACVARGETDCGDALSTDLRGRVDGRTAIARGPQSCFDAAKAVARAEKCDRSLAVPLEHELDRAGALLVEHAVPSCDDLAGHATALAESCARGVGPQGYLTIHGRPAAKIFIDHADTHLTTPHRAPAGRARQAQGHVRDRRRQVHVLRDGRRGRDRHARQDAPVTLRHPARPATPQRDRRRQ